MSDVWYKELGFETNPFSIKPNSLVIGIDSTLQKLKSRIKTGGIILLTGDYGTGKTAILKNLIEEFKGKRKLIYYSYNRKDGILDFDKLLYESKMLNKIIKRKPKKMILLLDEVEKLNIKEREELILNYKQGYFKAVVLVARNKKSANLNTELEELISKDYVQMQEMTSETAAKMIRNRIGSVDYISDVMIKRIFQVRKNPRMFLENCEDVCRYAFNTNSEKVNEKHLEILNTSSINHTIGPWLRW